MEETWTVYILRCDDHSYYVGCTNNFEKRLERHYKGEIEYTKTRLPLKPETKIIFTNKYLAYDFEKYLKSGSGRAFMNKRLIKR